MYRSVFPLKSQKNWKPPGFSKSETGKCYESALESRQQHLGKTHDQVLVRRGDLSKLLHASEDAVQITITPSNAKARIKSKLPSLQSWAAIPTSFQSPLIETHFSTHLFPYPSRVLNIKCIFRVSHPSARLLSP